MKTLAVVLALALLSAQASALVIGGGVGEVGSEVTIYDGDSKYDTGWYGKQEDQEVEPGMASHQKWDAEGMFFDGTNLTMVGGFDFLNGVAGYTGVGSEKDFTSGDIFIDIDGDRIAGSTTSAINGQLNVANTFGFDYVLDVNWAAGTYDVLSIDTQSTVTTAYYKANYGSSPWLYNNGGTLLGSGTLEYFAGLTDADTGFLGGSHYAVTGFDLSFLNVDSFDISWTMGCGNDHLVGSVSTVPEPGSIALLVFGLLGLGLARRRAA
ncbi:MAG: PEP-CTERM sorting domain-containing protein [Cellvibrionaceae bacterium]